MIREARQRARLSQADLARRAGVAQPVISAYEANRRAPSFATLTKLVEATGYHLAVELVPAPGHQLGLPDTRLGRRLRRHRRAIVDIASRRGIHNPRVFGSVARGEDTENSDVDLLVDLDDEVGIVSLAGLRRELVDLLGVDVDVVPANALKPGIRDDVLTEAIAL
ncbi:MAG TPA: helix-turn-helix domain-containing protein [Pseudonocardiaceae bacterium]|nr:helix-turn-helix domain-containing protein [Pseudonocardiaceae bacterium]